MIPASRGLRGYPPAMASATAQACHLGRVVEVRLLPVVLTRAPAHKPQHHVVYCNRLSGIHHDPRQPRSRIVKPLRVQLRPRHQQQASPRPRRRHDAQPLVPLPVLAEADRRTLHQPVAPCPLAVQGRQVNHRPPRHRGASASHLQGRSHTQGQASIRPTRCGCRRVPARSTCADDCLRVARLLGGADCRGYGR